jgi:integrase/recombinase XerD
MDGMTLTASVPILVQSHAAGDVQLVAMWLHGRPVHTQRTYAADAGRFLAFAEKPLATVTLGDLQDYADTLSTLAPATQARRLTAVKSLLSFGHRLGLLPVDVGRPLRLPRLKNTLAERILPEAVVQDMRVLEPNRRNRLLLRLLYAAGLRVSEVCALAWRDVQERDEAGQLTIFGKGEKTRVVLLSASTWAELVAFRPAGAGPDDPLFRSRKKGGALTPRQVQRLVRAAACRVGLDQAVSPHWLRHAHASHAIERGAPIHLVQATLGHASVATTGRYLHARPTDSSARYLGV